MSSIRSRNEKLFFDFNLQGQRHREQTLLDDTPANRRKLETVLKKVDSDIALNIFDYARYFPNSPSVSRASVGIPSSDLKQALPGKPSNAAPLFRDFAKTWQGEKQIEWRQSYREAVENLLVAHLLPVFGDQPIDAIERGAILGFRAGLITKPAPKKSVSKGKPRKPDTINRIIGILKQIFDEASDRHDFENPTVKIKRLKTQREDIVPFTMAEIGEILAAIRADYRDYLTVRFFTGLRSAEAHGLKWKHIDFVRGLILVRETFYAGRTESTKTDGSRRDLEVSNVVIEALHRRRAQFKGSDAEIADQYVFCTRFGRPIDNTNFNDRVWKPLLRNLNLAYRRPYQMRHTCATLWLAAGENPQWIAKQLGHSTTEMLFRTYGRYVPNLLRKDGSAFDSLISSALLGGVKESTPHSAKPARTAIGKRPAKHAATGSANKLENHFDE